MDDTLRFNGCLETNLEEATRRLAQIYEGLVGRLGLSVLEWYALRALYADDGISASQLAALVCRHPSSMTALLDRMEARGLLRREIDAADRRSVRVFLTAQGRAFEAQVHSVAGQLDHLLDRLITADQMTIFRHVLGVLQTLDLPESS